MDGGHVSMSSFDICSYRQTVNGCKTEGQVPGTDLHSELEIHGLQGAETAPRVHHRGDHGLGLEGEIEDKSWWAVVSNRRETHDNDK